MNEARFERVRQGHRAVLVALERLDAAAEPGRARAGASTDALVTAVGVFLERDAPALERVLDDEEREIFAALDAYLPQETESSASLRREHDTARSLLGLLRRQHEAACRGVPEAEAGLASAAHDLRLLLRDHFRKEDGVVRRLLERLMREKGDA